MTGGIERVAVLGAGTMGHGIAQVTAMGGFETVLCDTVEGAAEVGLERIAANLQGGIERGKLSPDDRVETLARLSIASELRGAVQGADLVIEAVPERFELKAALLGEVEGLVSTGCILASNTSGLSITSLQDGLERGERLVGVHFFNPVHIIPLVEIVRGMATGGGVVETALSFVRAIGKEPIVVRDSPGFASSRLGLALGLEAMRMVEEGVASPEAIDTAMGLGYRHPMGPLRLTDLIGLDIRLDIASHLYERLGSEVFRPPKILKRLVAEGKLGKKSGEGFYEWERERMTAGGGEG